jgi:hypothetical protein
LLNEQKTRVGHRLRTAPRRAVVIRPNKGDVHPRRPESRFQGQNPEVAGPQLAGRQQRSPQNPRRSHTIFNRGVNVSTTAELKLVLVLEKKIKSIFEGQK